MYEMRFALKLVNLKLHYQKMSKELNNNGGAETTAETVNTNLNTEKDTQNNTTTTTEKDTQQETKAPEQNAQETTEKDTQQETKAKVITILKKWGWKVALAVSIITAAITAVMWVNDVATRGDSVRYAAACQKYQDDSEPSIWRWASWDREIAAEALLEWSKEFEYYYLNSDDKPTAQEKGMYKRACTLRGLLKAGSELCDAINTYPNSSQVETYVNAYGYTSLLK